MTGRVVFGGAGALGRAGALGAALAAALLAACGGGGAQEEGGGGRGGGQGGGGQGAGGGRGGPTAVEVVAVAPRTVAETREVTGTLAPAREARLLAQLEGSVIRVRAEEGDRVAEGAVLAEFDATVQAAELAAAETRARTARLASARAERLLALGAASRGEREEALAALRDAEGQLSAARARAAYARVRSPFDGVVTAVRVDPGDVVGARQEVAVVSDVSALRAEVPVSELDLVRLRAGAPVAATVDALPGRRLAARIRRVYPAVDPTSRQGVVEVELPGAGPALVPGLLARLTFTVAEARDALAVPLDAVRRDVRDRPYVYVVQDVLVREPAGGDAGEKGADEKGGDEKKRGSAKGEKKDEGGDSVVVRRAQIVLRRPVEVGLRGGDNWVQLVRGVARGDRVVVSGDQELSDSARVRILPSRPGGGGGAGGAGGPSRG